MTLLQGFAFAAEPVLPFPVLPHHQDGRGDENGGIGTAENTHQQDDRKVTQGHAAEQRQRQSVNSTVMSWVLMRALQESGRWND